MLIFYLSSKRIHGVQFGSKNAVVSNHFQDGALPRFALFSLATMRLSKTYIRSGRNTLLDYNSIWRLPIVFRHTKNTSLTVTRLILIFDDHPVQFLVR